MFKDKYLKREELGIVYQLNVAPGRQRGLVGAALIKAAFERGWLAPGCGRALLKNVSTEMRSFQRCMRFNTLIAVLSAAIEA